MSEIVNKAAEGTLKKSNRAKVNWKTGDIINLRPVLHKYVVVESFFDPFVLTPEKISQLKSKYNDESGTLFENQQDVLRNQNLPRNSILARRVINRDQGDVDGVNSLKFLYPFFPSHIAMPCKPGEIVWVIYENLTAPDAIGYWICNIVGGQIEDVNHTHLPRSQDEIYGKFLSSTISPDGKKILIEPSYNFSDAPTFFFLQDPKIYERALKTSLGAAASVYESVPRFRKRPGDLAFEGSNNTLIVLGRDRTGGAVTYKSDTSKNANFGPEIIDPADTTLTKKNAGSIDIVAGRGQRYGLLEKGGRLVKNALGNIELAKQYGQISPNEGDPDFTDDRSRIYVSQNTNIDANLKLNEYNKNKLKVEDNRLGDAGIIIKSDKIRIFARSDVQIVVSGYDVESIPTGYNNADGTQVVNQIKNQKTDNSNWASVTIKSNGDIVLTPSKTGVIKLGDDTADKAILCTDLPATRTPAGVTAAPLLNSIGGSVGTGAANQGKFAKKVLVTG